MLRFVSRLPLYLYTFRLTHVYSLLITAFESVLLSIAEILLFKITVGT